MAIKSDAPTSPKLPRLHHITLQTARLDAMIDWYVAVLGMRATHRADFGAWLTNDEANHRVAIVTFPEVSERRDPRTHTGLRHVAFEFELVDDLMATYERVRNAGIEPDYCIDHGPTISFYYADPDGNYVELQVDTFQNWSDSAAFMAKDPAFHADPRGKDFDPVALHHAWAQGATLDELHGMAYAGGFAPTVAKSD
ncbi:MULTISPECIES: VOC family protein [unclassified Mycobacterium]|uniref:VOC family protein n=1 Tax=unclassified Mycobacterium TaxID=2642494 RepID=UPI0029C9B17F|nr:MULTISPECIES: VOC family protein [unclassified Mycobacterium]